ncbi:uncharacterized protein METZ01_LOCUS502647, partial [marine metagenome]
RWFNCLRRFGWWIPCRAAQRRCGTWPCRIRSRRSTAYS